MLWEASKWWENHLTHLDLMQSVDLLLWFHLWDYDPPPSLCLIIYVLLILIRHDDDALIFVGNMIGGMTHWLSVSIGNETSHIYSCFKRRIEHYMVATLYLLFLDAKVHMGDLCLWEKPLTWENLWQDMCCLTHIQLTPLILYYFQALEKVMVARRRLDGHLLYFD